MRISATGTQLYMSVIAWVSVVTWERNICMSVTSEVKVTAFFLKGPKSFEEGWE